MFNWLYTWMGLGNASGAQYLAWSGVIPALAGMTFVGGIFMHLKSRNCHVKGCKAFIHTAPDPKHGWYACKKHHSMGKKVGHA